MKQIKKSVLLISVCIFTILLASSVLAQLPAPPFAAKDIGDFFSKLFTGARPGTPDLFAKFLLIILLIAVLYRPAKMIVKDSKIGLLVAVIVSILAIRFLTPAAVYGVLLPYGALAIAVTILIPLALFAYFLIEGVEYQGIRKIGWILAAVVFLGLWWTRWTNIGDLAYFYLAGAVLSIAFFAFDGTIYKWRLKVKAERGSEEAAEQMRNALRGDEYRLAASLATATGDAERRRIREEIERIREAIREL